MRKIVSLLCLFAAVMIPMTVSAQGAFAFGDVDTYIAMLNGECPLEYDDAWALNAIESDGDTVGVVLQTPSSLAGFLSMLIGEGENYKRMWIKQLENFGRPWENLFRRLSEAGRPLVITFLPKGAKTTETIVFTPEDYKTLCAKAQDE